MRGTGWRTIVTNDTYRRAPWADVLYAADFKWWKHHIEAVRSSDFQGELWSQCGEARASFGTQWVQSCNRAGLGTGHMIHYGGNSGYQAINLAYLWGVRKFVLLGLDCGAGPAGEAHWFGQHPKPLNARQEFWRWALRFNRLAEDMAQAGAQVVNASRRTALECWPRADLGDLLADPVDWPRGGSRLPRAKASPATV